MGKRLFVSREIYGRGEVKVVDLLLRTTDTHFLKRPKDDSGKKIALAREIWQKNTSFATYTQEGGKNRLVSSDLSVEARRSKKSERSILVFPLRG